MLGLPALDSLVMPTYLSKEVVKVRRHRLRREVAGRGLPARVSSDWMTGLRSVVSCTCVPVTRCS